MRFIVGGKVKWRGEKVAYNSKGHDKRPKGSHRVRSNGLHYPHVVLCVLRLDCIRLIIGDMRFFVKIVGMFRLGESPIGLDLDFRGAAIWFRIDSFTHVGWCFPGWITRSMGEEDKERETKSKTTSNGEGCHLLCFSYCPNFYSGGVPHGVMRGAGYYLTEIPVKIITRTNHRSLLVLLLYFKKLL